MLEMKCQSYNKIILPFFPSRKLCFFRYYYIGFEIIQAGTTSVRWFILPIVIQQFSEKCNYNKIPRVKA